MKYWYQYTSQQIKQNSWQSHVQCEQINLEIDEGAKRLKKKREQKSSWGHNQCRQEATHLKPTNLAHRHQEFPDPWEFFLVIAEYV